MRRTKTLIGAVVAVLALSGVGAGVAVAETQESAPAPNANQDQQHPGKHPHKRLLGRVEHGELTLGGKQHRVKDIQRGKVAAVQSGSVTVRSKDGFTAKYTVDDKTKVRDVQDKRPEKVTDVHSGDRVRVVATKQDDQATANRINDRGPSK